MIRGQWTRIRDEWRANRRLRMAALVALAVLSTHAIAALEARKQAVVTRYTGDLELQTRLEGVSRQAAWTAHARRAAARLEAMREQVPLVRSSGLAQAELQSWLAGLATSAGVTEPRVRVEDTLDVPDHPGMWQVLARLDGQLPAFGQAAFVRAVSEGLPWIQVERLEIAEGTPARVGLIVRGYYRRDAADEAAAPMARQRTP